MIKGQDVFKPSDHLSWKILEDRTVVIDEQEGKLFHFNDTGAMIWNALDGQKNVTEIARALQGCFDSSFAQLEKDTKKFVDYLFQLELIQKVEMNEAVR